MTDLRAQEGEEGIAFSLGLGGEFGLFLALDRFGGAPARRRPYARRLTPEPPLAAKV